MVLLKELLFCGEIAFESSVKVEVILREIGEDGHGEVAFKNSLLMKGVGGDFDDSMAAVPVQSQTEGLLDVWGLGGCHSRFDLLVTKGHVDGSHAESRRYCVQNGVDEIAGGGLSVGAGDTDESDLP